MVLLRMWGVKVTRHPPVPRPAIPGPGALWIERYGHTRQTSSSCSSCQLVLDCLSPHLQDKNARPAGYVDTSKVARNVTALLRICMALNQVETLHQGSEARASGRAGAHTSPQPPVTSHSYGHPSSPTLIQADLQRRAALSNDSKGIGGGGPGPRKSEVPRAGLAGRLGDVRRRTFLPYGNLCIPKIAI